MEPNDKVASAFECELHFPIPLCMEQFNFYPVTVELKPKITGGE